LDPSTPSGKQRLDAAVAVMGPTFANEVEVTRLHMGRASAKLVERLEVVQKGLGLDSLDTKVFLPRADTELDDVIGAVFDENRAVRAAICL
jgi:hypothetical protein